MARGMLENCAPSAQGESCERVPPECNLRCDDHRLYLEVPNSQAAAKTVLVRCNRCGLVFEHPRPSRSEIDAFYSDVRLWTDSRDAEGKPRSYVRELQAKKPFFTDLARRIQKVKSSGKLLDVGAGAGLLQLALDRSKWSVTGVDISEFIAQFGRTELGTNVIHGAFEEMDFPEAHYDVIVFKYTLDHLEEPLAALRKARRLIRPDGWLVLADLINIDGFCARLFREGYRLIHPMHFTYFSPETISVHLSRAGFRVQKIELPFFRTPYCTPRNLTLLVARVIQRGLQRLLGIGHGRIYSVPFYGNMMDVWAVPE